MPHADPSTVPPIIDLAASIFTSLFPAFFFIAFVACAIGLFKYVWNSVRMAFGDTYSYHDVRKSKTFMEMDSSELVELAEEDTEKPKRKNEWVTLGSDGEIVSLKDLGIDAPYGDDSDTFFTKN